MTAKNDSKIENTILRVARNFEQIPMWKDRAIFLLFRQDMKNKYLKYKMKYLKIKQNI